MGTTFGRLTYRDTDGHWMLRIGISYVDLAPVDASEPGAKLRSLAESVRPIVDAWGVNDCSLDVIEPRTDAPPDGLTIGTIRILDGVVTVGIARPVML